MAEPKRLAERTAQVYAGARGDRLSETTVWAGGEAVRGQLAERWRSERLHQTVRAGDQSADELECSSN
jgi:hypothetical protein